jgi:peptidoglycan/LPS O-acetylase OafA/YrhL
MPANEIPPSFSGAQAIHGMGRGRPEPVQNEPLLRPVMPELDSIRGFAILMVIAYHAFYWQNDMHGLSRVARLFVYGMWVGRLGVNLFFVLSGFLITGILLQSARSSDYYRRFYLRRALRILPAYYAILLILAFVKKDSFSFLGLSTIYLSNMAPLFGIVMSYPVLWSLAVEEHFYLLWPTVVRNLTARRLASCSVAIILVTPLIRWLSFAIDSHSGYVSFTFHEYTWNSLDGLAFGAFLVIALREFGWNRRILLIFSSSAILAAIVIWLGGIPFGILDRQGTPVGAALQVVPWNFGFTGLLGLFLLLGTSKWKAVVLLPALRYFGRISYGLYLVHLLTFDAYDMAIRRFLPHLGLFLGTFPSICTRFLSATCAAVAIAHISRKYFESWFLNLKDRLGSPAAKTSLNAVPESADRDLGLVEDHLRSSGDHIE